MVSIFHLYSDFPFPYGKLERIDTSISHSASHKHIPNLKYTLRSSSEGINQSNQMKYYHSTYTMSREEFKIN